MKAADLAISLPTDNEKIKPDIVWLDVRKPPFQLHGLYNPQKEIPFRRVPEAVAKATSEGVAFLATHPAGGRARFRTDSHYIAVRCTCARGTPGPNVTLLAQSGFDLYRFDGERDTYAASLQPPPAGTPFYESVADMPGVMSDYMLCLPLLDAVSELYIGLQADATIETARPYRDLPPVVYYGSSITQGIGASRPGNSYEAMISRRFHLDFINLGFSGSARGETAIVEYLSSLTMSAFVCDYDHNAPDVAYLQATHLSLYKHFRSVQKDVPVIFVSKPDFENDAFAPQRRQVIRDTYAYAKAHGDEQVYFIDGETLFGTDGRDACTVDRCHPNDLGFYRMACVIGDKLQQVLHL